MRRFLFVILATLVPAVVAGFLVWKDRAPKLPERSPRRYVPTLDLFSPQELLSLPLAARFDVPIGTEHGAMAYNAQHFGEWNEQFGARHLGDDLNGIGGYNTDLGDPVFAAATGRVHVAEEAGPGWGKVVLILHATERDGVRRYVQSFYAHLNEILVRKSQLVHRGERIGTIGNAGGRYFAHLHLELREFPTPFLGAGYRDGLAGWLSPSQYLRDQRGAPDADLLSEPPEEK